MDQRLARARIHGNVRRGRRSRARAGRPMSRGPAVSLPMTVVIATTSSSGDRRASRTARASSEGDAAVKSVSMMTGWAVGGTSRASDACAPPASITGTTSPAALATCIRSGTRGYIQEPDEEAHTPASRCGHSRDRRRIGDAAGWFGGSAGTLSRGPGTPRRPHGRGRTRRMASRVARAGALESAPGGRPGRRRPACAAEGRHARRARRAHAGGRHRLARG